MKDAYGQLYQYPAPVLYGRTNGTAVLVLWVGELISHVPGNLSQSDFNTISFQHAVDLRTSEDSRMRIAHAAVENRGVEAALVL